MDITPQLQESAPIISRYGGGGFTVAGQRYEGNLLITTTSTLACNALTTNVIESLIQQKEPIELLLIGTGLQPRRLSPEHKDALEARQIVYDIMDTGAACRTFNILLAEARRVAVFIEAI